MILITTQWREYCGAFGSLDGVLEVVEEADWGHCFQQQTRRKAGGADGGVQTARRKLEFDDTSRQTSEGSDEETDEETTAYNKMLEEHVFAEAEVWDREQLEQCSELDTVRRVDDWHEEYRRDDDLEHKLGAGVVAYDRGR